MTREEREELIKHLEYDRSIGADYLITDTDADEIIKALEQEPCEDAVSRKDCINAIENTDCELSPQAWKEITNNIMSLSPATPTEKWIPISERLPKPQREIGSEDFSDWVLVSIRINPYQSIVCSAYYCFSEKKWYMERFGCGKIVAWMPLPKAYKAESEDKE